MHSLTFKPLQLIKVTTPRVGQLKLVPKRLKIIVMKSLCVAADLLVVNGNFLKLLSQEEHDELLAIFKTPITITAENTFALKSDLMIPSTKLRGMRQFQAHTQSHTHL